MGSTMYAEGANTLKLGIQGGSHPPRMTITLGLLSPRSTRCLVVTPTRLMMCEVEEEGFCNDLN